MEKSYENKAITKIKKKQKKERRHTQFYYSFLTIVLFVCFLQMSFSAMLNITKVIAYHKKIGTLKNKQELAKKTNEELKRDLKNFSTTEAMESIGRNNLKMAGKHEVMIILNQQQLQDDSNTKEKHKKFGFKKQ